MTAAATEATEAGRATSNLTPSGSIRTPTSSRPSRHSPLSGHCGPGHLAAGSISGLRDGPCGQGGGEGRRGPRGVRYKEVLVRKEGEEGRPDRGRGMAARPGSGREERRGKGGGRESGGGNNVAGAAPAEFRFRTPPPRFEFGTSRRPPGSAPDSGSGAAEAPRAPRPGGSGGHRLAGAGGTAGRGPAPTAARPGGRPARTPPRQAPRAGCGVGREREGGGGGGGGGRARLARGSAGRKLAGLARGSAARILRPRQRACARGPARRAAGRGPEEWRPLSGAGGTAGGVSAPTPCPHLPARAEGSRRSLREGRPGRRGATSEPSLGSSPRCRSD